MLNSKTDYLWHRWINERSQLQRGDYDGPCQNCGKLLDEHGEMTRLGRRCPTSDEDSFFLPKPFVFDTLHPNVATMYAFKSAISMLKYAGNAIKKARTGQLPLIHQQCSHCKPEKLEHNTMRCWLGEDVAKCPILNDFARLIDEERSRVLPDGRPSYYADVTDDEVYWLMGYVCVWHLLMSHIASEMDKLPQAAYVDWNEGAFQDESDRIFWQRTYENMSQPSGHPEDEEANDVK